MAPAPPLSDTPSLHRCMRASATAEHFASFCSDCRAEQLRSTLLHLEIGHWIAGSLEIHIDKQHQAGIGLNEATDILDNAPLLSAEPSQTLECFAWATSSFQISTQS